MIGPQAVHSTVQATVLGSDGCTITMTEHCLAALAAFGIDNAVVEVDAGELPIGDGSANIYVEALERSGAKEQDAAREFIVITEKIVFGDDQTYAAISPYDGLRITCSIAFAHRVIGEQSLSIDVDENSFKKQIGLARTFGFLKDWQPAIEKGIGLGASLDNTVVLDDTKVLNDGGLRFPDEFVRHKVLDSLGDLAVLGKPVRGHLETRRSGHGVMQGLVKKIASSRQSFRCQTL